MKRLLLPVALNLLFVNFCLSQKDQKGLPTLTLEKNSSQNINETKNDYLKLIEGEFQFQISKNDHKVMLYPDLLTLIQNSRLENEDVYLIQDEFVTIFIPSKTKINSDQFSKLEMFLYTNNK